MTDLIRYKHFVNHHDSMIDGAGLHVRRSRGYSRVTRCSVTSVRRPALIVALR